MRTLVVTVLSNDRKGIIEDITSALSTFSVNWTESHFMNFAGKFTGILQLEVSQADKDGVIEKLNALSSEEMQIQVSEAQAPSTQAHLTEFSITANDRSGIVREVSQQLSGAGFSIQSLETSTNAAAMSGDTIFSALVVVSHDIDSKDDILELLERSLECLQDDLLIELYT